MMACTTPFTIHLVALAYCRLKGADYYQVKDSLTEVLVGFLGIEDARLTSHGERLLYSIDCIFDKVDLL